MPLATHPRSRLIGWGRCLPAVLLLALTAVLACGAELAGKTFEITLMSGKARSATLSFTANELVCKGVGTLPYTTTAKPRRVIAFEATASDGKGGSTVVSGEVNGKDIHGTITHTPKEGTPSAINFTSVKAER